MHPTNFETKAATVDELYQLSLQYANSTEGVLYIYEKYSLDTLLGKDKSAEVRQLLLKNKIVVNQISNFPQIEDTLQADEVLEEAYKKKVMNYHYVPAAIFEVAQEMVIFDDFVAWYTADAGGTIKILQDRPFAENQKQLFRTLQTGESLPLINTIRYTPNHSFYNSIDYDVAGTQVIVWPDADAKDSYSDMDQAQLGVYLQTIIEADAAYYSDASYLIVFIWSYDGEKMADVWKFTDNTVDDRSGPLSNVRVYREGAVTSELGLSSGNTLLVLGHEEKLRRQSRSLQEYLDGNPPELPLEVLNRQDFFPINK